MRYPYIEDLALQKQRDVVLVIFYRHLKDWLVRRPHSEVVNWDKHPIRSRVIKFLDENDINYQPTMGTFDSDLAEFDIYAGCLYIDVPFDEDDPQYQKVQRFLEFKDGTSRFEHTIFCYCRLSDAHKDRSCKRRLN